MKEFKITEKERNTMLCELRPWRMEDATELQKILNNKKILDNLRDGIPYPYTLADAKAFIQSMSEAEPDSTYAFAITADGRLAAVSALFGKKIFIPAQRRSGIILLKRIGGGELVLTLLSGSAAIFFKIQICFGSLPSPLLIIRRRAGFWKRLDLP